MFLLLGMLVAASAGGGAPPSPPREAPLLDRGKATRAAAAYSKFMNELCDSLWLTPDGGEPMRPRRGPYGTGVEQPPARHAGDDLVEGKLSAIGLERGDDVALCDRREHPARPIATGSFVMAGADEVLLEVWSGSTGLVPSTLALLRADGKAYRFVAHLPIGIGYAARSFRARTRWTTPAGRDVLFLCEAGGMQGLYQSTCGFFGRGTFREPLRRLPTIANPSGESPADADRNDELQLVSLSICGPVAEVELGKIAAHRDRLFVDLILVAAVAEHAAGAEDSIYCDRETRRTERRFTIEYKFDGATFHRLTPIPREVTDALNKN